jgi:hypothetical protein
MDFFFSSYGVTVRYGRTSANPGKSGDAKL